MDFLNKLIGWVLLLAGDTEAHRSWEACPRSHNYSPGTKCRARLSVQYFPIRHQSRGLHLTEAKSQTLSWYVFLCYNVDCFLRASNFWAETFPGAMLVSHSGELNNPLLVLRKLEIYRKSKVSTKRLCVLFTQFPPKVTSYIIITQYQTQESDIGMICVSSSVI